MNYTKPRGTVDLLDQDIRNFRTLEQILRTLAELFCYYEVKTPMFESADLFKKSVGEESDIVTKEIYTFLDKGDRELALRPEGTASAIRAIVEAKKLTNSTLLSKIFYFGEMFRYERPQNGRQRQFHQFGIECVGDFNEYDEVEVILFAEAILKTLKISDYELEINNLGSNESRRKYIEHLKIYFKKYENELSEDSKRRLDKNPLRILDDKIDSKKDFVLNAPSLKEFLTDEENEYFNKIKELLDLYKIKYKVNNNLVRGLDYYNGLVFEFISNSKALSAQSTIIGGGRYDSLVKQTGGPDVKGIGFGIGIERLLLILGTDNALFNKPIVNVIILPLSEQALKFGIGLCNVLRLGAGISCNISNKTFRLDKHFKYVDKFNCENVVILDDESIKNNIAILKNQETRKEEKVKIEELINKLKNNYFSM